MQKTFIETTGFTQWFRDNQSEEELEAVQRELLIDPDKGKVMPGCGGLRKMRMADPTRHKGKRSGVRIVYLHIPEVDEIYFITAYDKDRKDDLSPEDKKLFRQLVAILKQYSQRNRPRSES